MEGEKEEEKEFYLTHIARNIRIADIRRICLRVLE